MKILFASSNLPTPPTSGGAQRTDLLLRSVEQLGAVDCAFLVSSLPGPDQLAALHDRCTVRLIAATGDILRRRHPFLRPARPDSAAAQLQAFLDGGQFRWQPYAPFIRQLGPLDDYDLIVVRYLQVAATLGLFGRKPLALDVDDYDPARLQLRLGHASRWKRLTLHRCLRHSTRAHNQLLQRAHHLWVADPADRKHPHLEAASILPNIPWIAKGGQLPPLLPLAANSRRFLIVASFDYSANVDGIECFLREAWPKVHSAFPDARFDIVGKGLEPGRARRWARTPGVEVHGFIADLATCYRDCLATVAPILAGGGTNIKVLESAAYARPPLLTRVAHRGFAASLPAGHACMVADSVAAMADDCIELLNNPTRAKAIGDAAHQAVATHHTYSHFQRVVEAGCESALHAPVHARPL